MATIKNVAVVGASGGVGVPVVNALVKSGKFNVTIVKRPSTTATFPDSVTVRTADLSSVESVTAAFEGQDAVVSTVGTAGVPGQNILVEAAVAAGVKRFLPSDFGCDIGNPKTGALPVYKLKVATHKALREAAEKKPDFSYTLVCTNAILDLGIQRGILLNWRDSKPKIFDGGKSVFSATTLETIGQTVVGVLTHPEETKNRFVYVKDLDITQNQLLDIAKKLNPGKTWEDPIQLDTGALEKSSYESLAKGEITPFVMAAFILRVIFGPLEYGGQFTKTDNELFGIKGKSEADLEALFKSIQG